MIFFVFCLLLCHETVKPSFQAKSHVEAYMWNRCLQRCFGWSRNGDLDCQSLSPPLSLGCSLKPFRTPRVPWVMKNGWVPELHEPPLDHLSIQNRALEIAFCSGSFQTSLPCYSVMLKHWKLCRHSPSQTFSRKLSLVLISSTQEASFKTVDLHVWSKNHSWKGCPWNGRKLEKQEPDLGGWPDTVARTCGASVSTRCARPHCPSPGPSAEWQRRAPLGNSSILPWAKAAWQTCLLPVPRDTALLCSGRCVGGSPGGGRLGRIHMSRRVSVSKGESKGQSHEKTRRILQMLGEESGSEKWREARTGLLMELRSKS